MNLDILKSRQIGNSSVTSLSYLYEWESIFIISTRKQKLRKIFKKDF